MRPWLEASSNDRWVLREPGKQMLVCGNNGELNLSSESGSFQVNSINPKTGEVSGHEAINAGPKVRLPNASIVWLVKE